MIHLRVRWRVVLQPLCRVVGHRWRSVMAGTAFDRSGQRCQRCCVFEYRAADWSVEPEPGEAWPAAFTTKREPWIEVSQ